MINKINCQFENWKQYLLARGKYLWEKNHLGFGLILFCFGFLPINGFSQLNTPPIARCKAAAIMPSFHLDATCNRTITPDDVDDGSSDAETAVADLIKSVSPSSFSGIGMYEVTLTITDEGGLTDQCKTTISVVDNMPPTITCENHRVSLVNGIASIIPTDVFSDARDNCSGTTVTLSEYNFSCIDIGDNTIEVTVTDDAGQTATCSATVTVVDNSAPVIKCSEDPIVVVLDEFGEGAITEEQALISIGTTCGDVKITIERTNFSCEDAGDDLTIPVSIEDKTNGNVSTCNILVKVRDEERPVIECVDPLTVFLSHVDEDLQIKLLPENLVSSATDNCGIDFENSRVSVPFVDCSDAETNVPVTVTIVDPSGNEASCTVDIKVDDNASPNFSCIDSHLHRTFTLDNDGKLNIDLAALGAPNTLYTFSDNCAIAPSAVTIDPVHFTCEEIGGQTVTLTASDGHGNNATCDIIINVIDDIDPIVVCLPNRIRRDLDKDVKEIIITYEDLIFAEIDHPDNLVTDFINDNCEVELIKIALKPSDPAEEPVFVDELVFNCEDLGNHDVIIKVWDTSDNMATCEAGVRIRDRANPHAFCVDPFDLPLVLDEMGNFFAIVTADDIAFDVEDNCEVDFIKINGQDELRFDCSDIVFDADGLPIPIEITLVATDLQNNEGSCVTYVTPVDNVKPTLECPEEIMSVDLDDMGNGTITIEMVRNFILANGGSFADECGDLTFEVSQEEYDCGNVGAHTITFTVIDKSGNETSCDLNVWVQDNTAPVVACKPNGSFNPLPFTLNNGELVLTVEDILKSADDNCGVSGLSISPNEFDCSHIGIVQSVMVTASDVEGNTGTCTALILIGSSSEPRAVCQDVELILDADGMAELTINMVNDGSEGDCETTLSFDETILVETLPFDCSDVFDADGEPTTHEVTLYVTDKAGTQVSCTANITVRDETPPIANCRTQPLDLRLVDGRALVPVRNISTNSNDACSGPVKLSVEPAQFDCSHVGELQIVVLTVEDESGNTSNCEANVNVINDQAPALECKPGVIPIALDEMGMAILEVEDLLADNSVPCATGVVYEIVVEGRADPKFTCDDINFEDLANPFLFNVTLRATANGQTVECKTQVEIVDGIAPTLDCASDVVILELDAWGKVEITSENLPFTAVDNCGLRDTIFSNDLFSCTATMNGEIEVTITVIDSARNETSCIRKVEIVDNILPTIVCPDDVELAPTEGCMANHTWVIPVPEDKCGIKEVFVGFESNNDANTPQDVLISEDGLTASYDFPSGTTVVTYRVVDNNGNQQFCIFRVTVTDTQAPDFVNCPTTTVLAQTDPGECFADISLADDLKIGVSDNCDLVSYTCKYTYQDNSVEEVDALTNFGHSAFPKGRTEVLLTAIDANGNISTCSFEVLVADEEAPTISFNDSYSALQGLVDGDMIEVPLEDVELLGEWNASVLDNCPGVRLESFVEVELSGNTCATNGYSKTLLCTWTAIDEHGNTTSLSITVNIKCPVIHTDLFVNKNSINPTFSVGDRRDLLINFNEINGGDTEGTMQFSIGKSSGFSFEFNPNQTILGSIPVNNSDWTLQDVGSFYLFTSKAGMKISGGTTNRVAITVIANKPGTETNLQAKLSNGNGGDIDDGNNLTNLSFTIQRNE